MSADDDNVMLSGWRLDPDDLATEKVDDEAILAQIDKLSMPQYERRREEFADMHGVRVAELDKEVRRRRRALSNDGLAGEEWAPTEIDPWPTAIPDLAPHLTRLAEILAEYVVFLSKEATDAVVLWGVTTHLHDLARWSPYLMVWSPEVESGKTSLLKIVIQLVQRAAPVANISAAMLYRVIAQWSPTLMIDQLDSLLKSGGERAEEIRNILDSGHEKQFAYVVRGVGDDHQPRRFSTFCPKALGHQGRKPHPSIVSRSLVIELERKEARQTVKDDPASDPRFAMLARILARWCADHHDEVAAIKPVLPDGLGNRRGNNWRLMLAIADAVGGEWPERASCAALAISGGPVEELARIDLLADLRALFYRQKGPAPALASIDIVKALHELEDRPWSEWSRTGKPITVFQVASLLAPLKVKPKQVWIAGENQRGYRLADLARAFARYLPPDLAPAQVARSLEPKETATSEPFQVARTDQILATQDRLKATELNGSSDLATQNPPTREDEGASDVVAAKAKTLESILKRFRRLARDVRESPDEGDTDWDGGWPLAINHLADAIADFAEKYRDKDSIHAIVTAVLITAKLGIGGERGTAAHRYLWDRAVHLAEPEDRKRLIQARPDFDNEPGR